MKNQNKVLSITPVRIDFGGGATDVEPFSSEHGGYTINSTINRFIKSTLSIRNDKKIKILWNNSNISKIFDLNNIFKKKNNISDLIEAVIYYIKSKKGMNIEVDIEPPNRSGLGSSASLCTSLIAGIFKLNNKSIDKDIIAEIAYHVEQDVLKNLGGRQDQYASVYGGFNCMTFLGENNVKIEKLKITKSFRRLIEKNLILYFTTEPHISGDMVKMQIDSYIKKREESTLFLNRLKQIALEMRDALISEDFEKFGELLTMDMMVKSKFNPYLLTNYMKLLHNLVKNNGGIGGRVSGAGGGGCMIWLIEPNTKEEIINLLNKQKGRIINYKFINKGLDISSI